MASILLKGVVRGGHIETAVPIDLPDGSEVMIFGQPTERETEMADDDRPRTPAEIAATLAAMDKVEPFEMTDEERAAAEAWERKVNDYSIANFDKGLEDVFR
jgi:hypothetical protein